MTKEQLIDHCLKNKVRCLGPFKRTKLLEILVARENGVDIAHQFGVPDAVLPYFDDLEQAEGDFPAAVQAVKTALLNSGEMSAARWVNLNLRQKCGRLNNEVVVNYPFDGVTRQHTCECGVTFSFTNQVAEDL